jgi:large subunit ribosomal protein L35
MASSSQGLRATLLCSSCLKKHSTASSPSRFVRAISQSVRHQNPETTSASTAETQSTSDSTPPFDLRYAHTKLQLREAAEKRTPLVGSLRYRWARSTNQGIPFEQLPYQCFQEARKVLGENRNEVLKKIELMRGRIARLSEKPVETRSEIASKEHSLKLMRKKLETYKIEADINDPLVKKKFEDGMGK